MGKTGFLQRLKAGIQGFADAFNTADEIPWQTPAPKAIGLSVNCADEAWLATVNRIINEGVGGEDRTGTGTRAVFGHMTRVPLMRDGKKVLPVVSIKKTSYQDAIAELQWMISGENSIVPLLKQGIHIWTDWPKAAFERATGEKVSRDEFERRILEDEAFAKKWGIIDPCYGTQMRKFPTPDGPFDQFAQLIEEIKRNPYSRRLLWSLWTPAMTIVSGGTGLPPCHWSGQVSIKKNEVSGNNILDLIVTMRSHDIGLGYSYNQAQYGYLAHLLCVLTNCEPGHLIISSHDTHLYANHLDLVATVLDREVRPDPEFVWKRIPASINDLRTDDYEVIGYDPQPFLRLPVAV